MEYFAPMFDRKDTKNVKACPLWYHKRNLMQTATGYGRKLTSEYKVFFKGRWRRVYYCCYSNIGTFFIMVNGAETTIDIY